jgi:hypothetical protein
VSESHNNTNNAQGGQSGGQGQRNNRRRRSRHGRGGENQANRGPDNAPRNAARDNRGNDNRGNDNRGNDNRGNDNRGNDNRGNQGAPRDARPSRSGGARRRGNGRPLTVNQVIVKYDNLLEQHLIMRRKYHDYFNRVDDRQLRRLEKNFFDSIEHLRRFEANLEPWQREALEQRKTERYRPDLTYSTNHGLDPAAGQIEVAPEEIEDPHFKDSQKEAFAEYKEDTEESEGTFEDYLKLKGLA